MKSMLSRNIQGLLTLVVVGIEIHMGFAYGTSYVTKVIFENPVPVFL